MPFDLNSSNSVELGPTPKQKPELPWLQVLTATVDKEGITTATCTALLVERGDGDPHFQKRMEMSSQEAAELASDLFTSGGYLKPELRGHGTRGNAVRWSDEFDRGNILIFEHLKVAKSERRQGLATHLVKSLIEHTRRENPNFSAFVAPGALESEYRHCWGQERARIIAEEVSTSVQFWRAQGFIRVGGTNWLAISSKRG